MIENQRVWAEIHCDNIAHNIKKIREIVPKTAELMAVVKADGYGHGAVECAKHALYNGATWLGVAILEEAISLRENNIFEPIIILGYTPKLKLMEAVKYDFVQTVFHTEMAKTISDACIKLHKKAKIHIKIDTGMSRLGFMPNRESVKQIMEISQMEGIDLCGVYTHFADSDSVSSTFTGEQFLRFTSMVEMLKTSGLTGFMAHCSNSAAVLQFPQMSLDMVRTGILTYGMSPSTEIDVTNLGLKPVMSFKTRISYIKKLEKGVSIGYGRTFYTQRETVVATVPVGYADGYFRNLSNKANVLVCGQFAPVIGNICMDQFMIDITNIPTATEGSVVTLFGSDGDNAITADQLAALLGTINYEIVCGVSKRVPRVYFKNGSMIKMVTL